MSRFSFFSDGADKNDLTQKPENDHILFSLPDSGKKRYQSRHHNEMLINNSMVSDFFHEQEFESEFFVEGTMHEVLLSVIQSNYEDGLGLKDQLGGLLKKVTDLKNILRIQLSPVGKMLAVTNKSALQQDWNFLKESIFENPEIKSLPADVQQQMIAKGDEEFGESYPLHLELEKSLFHSSLLRGFYNQPFILGNRYAVTDIVLVSTFFEELSIPMKIHLEVVFDEQYDEFILKYEGNVDKMAFDTARAKILYNKQYPFLQEKFERYALDFQAMYVLDKQDHQIRFARINVNEKINQTIESLIDLEIEEVNHG